MSFCEFRLRSSSSFFPLFNRHPVCGSHAATVNKSCFVVQQNHETSEFTFDGQNPTFPGLFFALRLSKFGPIHPHLAAPIHNSTPPIHCSPPRIHISAPAIHNSAPFTVWLHPFLIRPHPSRFCPTNSQFSPTNSQFTPTH